MAYRVPKSSSEYAGNIALGISASTKTYLPTSLREDVRSSTINEHFRFDILARASLEYAGHIRWEELYNVTLEELVVRKVLNRTSIIALLEYAHRLSRLAPNDSDSDLELKRLLNNEISNSDLIIFESNISSAADYFTSPVRNWSEVEQQIFCWRFFADEQPHKVARKVDLSSAEIIRLYSRLLQEFQNIGLLGDLIHILNNYKWKIFSVSDLLGEFPEFDIRPFGKLKNYRTLDLITSLLQIPQFGETIVDLSRGSLGKDIFAKYHGQLIELKADPEERSPLNQIHPAVIEEYIRIIGFKSNHLYCAYPLIDQKDLIVQYMKIRNAPAKRSEIKADLLGLLDSKNLTQKIYSTNGKIFAITNEDFALDEWGYEPFVGATEIITKYISESGPTHIEMFTAILDGYGISGRKIKEITTSPPLTTIGGVCFLMDEEY